MTGSRWVRNGTKLWMMWLIDAPRPASALPKPSSAVRWSLRVSSSKVEKKSSSSTGWVEFSSGIVAPGS